MEDERYNGWQNRETWLLKLWIDNEPGSYWHWQERSLEVCKEAESGYEWESERDGAIRTLAKELEEWVKQYNLLHHS